jgi:hypothetical protein
LSNPEGVPGLGLNTVIRKDPFIPIPPACDWGQGPVLEGILPQGRLSKSRFERDSLGFGCYEFVRIRNSHRAEEIRCRIGLSTNQKLSGKLLLGKAEKKSQVKIEKLSAE